MGSRVRLLALSLVLAGMLVAGCGASAGGNAATVNGTAITMAAYEKQVKIAVDQLVSQGLEKDTADGKATIAELRIDMLSQMVDTELMRQAAAKEGIAVTDADIAARMAEIKTDAGDSAFKQMLKDYGLTEEDFRLLVRDQTLYERLYDKVTASLPKTAEQVRVRHILLSSDADAAKAQGRLAKGEDFAALAKELSLDTQTGAQGGDLGFYPRGVFDPAFEQTVFALKVNEIAKVQTDYGFHVVQLMEKDANRALDPEIQQYLGEVAINSYMDGVRATAKIERLVKFPATPTPAP